jgi:UrcA family protein
MKTMFKVTVTGSRVLAAAALGLVLAAGSASAGSDVHAVAVRYGDLDLSGEEGVRALYGRLEAAADRVCGPRSQRDLGVYRLWRNCRDDALARAVTQIGNARLAALHGQRRTRAS